MSVAQINMYKQLLKNHDWHFEWSDDSTVYRHGREERKRITDLAHALDPDGVIWNQYAPKCYQVQKEPA